LQKVDQLKNKSWDVTLDGIITDQHFYPASIDA
jgi:5-formyltetrahydrofolate cyclo-ligase